MYKYDQLNRIKQMQTYQSITGNAWGSTSTNAYKEVYAYDANGNIKTLERRNETGTIIDQLDYRYNKDASNHLVNNRLNYIYDPIPDGTSTYDVDGQSLNNYGYDAIGNLKSDVKERIGEIKWNVYGKVSEIIRERNTTNTASDLAFVYDAMGNRVCKIEKPYNYLTNPSGWLYTFYVRDASGNIMSTYKKTGDQIEDAVITLDEVLIYGNSRVGVRQVGKTIAQLEAETSLYLFNRRLGLKRYEMTNHLGNVLTTFTDRKYQIQSSGIVTGYKTYITSAQDYYAFGMGMNLRSWNASSYRFGFNGQERVDEISGTGNHTTALFWEYDPRTGRRWNQDPKPNPSISNYSALANNPIANIDPLGDTWDPDLWKEKPWYDFNKILYSIGLGGRSHEHFLSPASYKQVYDNVSTLNAMNPVFKRAWDDVKKSKRVYGINELPGGPNIKEAGVLKGLNITLYSDGFDKGTIFEEVFHAGQQEFYFKGVTPASFGLAIEVEAKVAKALTGVKDDFGMTEAQKNIMGQYYNTLKSGKTVSNKLRIDVNKTLRQFATTLVKKGGYGKYEDQLKTFNPSGILKYFEKIIKDQASSTKEKKEQ